MSEHMTEEAVERAGPKFEPPLYMQRYTTVRDILYKIPGIEKVVDFGCSEGKFVKYLKKLPFTVEISCVDILNSSSYRTSQVSAPLSWDYVFRRYKELTIKIFCGSALERDARLQGYDAVTCIELIEHLQHDDLKPLISNIFGFICPKVAIFTTPNKEFNVLFPQLNNFRHWDHKFEWTRVEFAEWCSKVVEEYPDYSFEIQGVGEPPPESSSLGCCSQLAIFQLKLSAENAPLKISNFSDAPYTLGLSLDCLSSLQSPANSAAVLPDLSRGGDGAPDSRSLPSSDLGKAITSAMLWQSHKMARILSIPLRKSICKYILIVIMSKNGPELNVQT